MRLYEIQPVDKILLVLAGVKLKFKRDFKKVETKLKEHIQMRLFHHSIGGLDEVKNFEEAANKFLHHTPK